MATLTKSTGTVTLSGAVEKVTLPAAYGWVWAKNMSDADMFVGLSDGISAGADGVMRIPAGECGRVQTDGQDSVYLMGSGNALVVAQNYADCPFKAGGKGGEIPDLSAYAKKTDVPNIKVNSAGNADTVNGHTVDADVPADAKFTDTVPDLTLYALKSKYGDTTIDVGRKAGTTVGIQSTAEGRDATASGDYSHAEGYNTTASGNFSHAEGQNTTASGNFSHAEGQNTTASGDFSHAEGHSTTASGDFSHAEGRDATASGNFSHAEGHSTTASGMYSHAEGHSTTASGMYSHAEGISATASGEASHAGGSNTKALHNYEVAYGICNVSNSNTLFSIGDGTSGSDRHNAFEITTTGGMLHDKDILTSAHIMQFIPYNLKYHALNDRILLFSNDDALARGIYFVNNTPNDITVCALISASAAGPAVQYGYGSNTYPEIQNTGEGRDWYSIESVTTSPTILAMTVPSGKLGYYGLYSNSEAAYTTIHDIRCPYFNYF